MMANKGAMSSPADGELVKAVNELQAALTGNRLVADKGVLDAFNDLATRLKGPDTTKTPYVKLMK